MYLIPPNATTHYKAAFSIENGPDLVTRLRKVIRKWCSEKFNDRDNWGGSWFFIGSNEQLKIGSALVRVASNTGSFEPNNPSDWAIEIIHSDSRYRERNWSIEIGISRLSENQARFATSIKHWIKEGYIGVSPPEPLSTTPRIVKDILRLKGISCNRGDLLPDFRTNLILVESIFRTGDGHEETLFRRTDYRFFERG